MDRMDEDFEVNLSISSLPPDLYKSLKEYLDTHYLNKNVILSYAPLELYGKLPADLLGEIIKRKSSLADISTQITKSTRKSGLVERYNKKCEDRISLTELLREIEEQRIKNDYNVIVIYDGGYDIGDYLAVFVCDGVEFSKLDEELSEESDKEICEFYRGKVLFKEGIVCDYDNVNPKYINEEIIMKENIMRIGNAYDPIWEVDWEEYFKGTQFRIDLFSSLPL